MLRHALVWAAVLAAGLAPAMGQTEPPKPTTDSAPPKPPPPKPLPAKATQELPAEMLALLERKRMPKLSPIVVRIFKEESELEVWKQDAAGRFQHLKTWPICRWSGDLGPKFYEGDRQSPEGFYAITPAQMNPNSNYHLSINLGYPNAFDRAHRRSGSFLMIHGDCLSIGCYAMTDDQISEIYALARDTFRGGRPSFQVQAYPFRLTPANLARHRNNPNMAFWKMLKVGNDHFETTGREPKVDVCERRYVFDAVAGAAGAFNAGEKCPAFVIDPETARRVQEKARADELAIARLVRDNVPAAPIYTGFDGGMHKAFVARYPGRVTFAMVMPYASRLPRMPPVPWVDGDGSVPGRWFGVIFSASRSGSKQPG
jgi:murein L,D-transpeptidase YafK